VGTGRGALYIGEESERWGLAQWAKPLIGLTLDAGVDAVDYQCRQLLGEHYHRLNPWLEGAPIRLDDTDALPRLAAAAEAADLEPTLAWLDNTMAPAP
jgi:hypothetical protein